MSMMMLVTLMMNGCKQKEEFANASSRNSGAEDAEGAEDKHKNVWKTKNNQFNGDLLFLGELKVNVQTTVQ